MFTSLNVLRLSYCALSIIAFTKDISHVFAPQNGTR